MKSDRLITLVGRAHGLDRDSARFTLILGGLRRSHVVLCQVSQEERARQAFADLWEGCLTGLICSVQSERDGILTVEASRIEQLGGRDDD
jgi:hypothetical protein